MVIFTAYKAVPDFSCTYYDGGKSSKRPSSFFIALQHSSCFVHNFSFLIKSQTFAIRSKNHSLLTNFVVGKAIYHLMLDANVSPNMKCVPLYR